MESSRYLLRPEIVRRVLTRAHLTHQQFADHLGLSRSYWSQLFHRRRHLTPMIRQTLLGSRYLAGLREEELWEVTPTVDPDPVP